MTDDFVHDEGHHNKYFHVLPNMYDDDLNPYEYRLIGHYKRVGISWEGTRKIAKVTQMSIGKVTQTRKALEEKRLIRVEYLTRKELKDRGFDIREKNPDDKVKIVVTAVRDVMAENIARYQKGVHVENSTPTPVHVVNTPVQDMNIPVHVVNERITIEQEPIKKPKAQPNPILGRWKQVAQIGDELLKVFKNDFVPVENQTTAAIEPYLIVAEDFTRIGTPVEHIAPLHRYIVERAERENWATFSVKVMPKYYTEYLKTKQKPIESRKQANIIPFEEKTPEERAALAEARKNIRPDWKRNAEEEEAAS